MQGHPEWIGIVAITSSKYRSSVANKAVYVLLYCNSNYIHRVQTSNKFNATHVLHILAN